MFPPGGPPRPTATVAFGREDEARTVRFTVKAPNTVAMVDLGQAVARGASGSYDRGYQTVEYPHIQRRHPYSSADGA